MSQRALDAVLFDVGGTLLRVQPSVGDVYAQVALDHGFCLNPVVINQSFRAAWKKSLERSRARNYCTSDLILRQEWLEIVRDTFGGAIPDSAIQPFFADLYERFVSIGPWRVAPGIRETLAYLRGEGVRLGVLSNWDSRLERMLQELQLGDAFDFIVVSHAVGFEKPHPEIFDWALRQAMTSAGRTLHVGDCYHSDISPARRAGLQTLWLAPESERRKEGYQGLGFESLPERPLPIWRQIVYAEPPC